MLEKLFAAILVATPATAKSCTPSPLRQFVAQHKLKVISAYRRGARIAGTRHRSLHSFCDGRRGAVDVRWKRGIVGKARRKGFGVGTYSRCTGHNHIHISYGGWETSFHKGCKRNRRKVRRYRRKR
jgi:hypothetical protein